MLLTCILLPKSLKGGPNTRTRHGAARVRSIVTIFSDVTAAALQALPVLPTASPAREGHHADSEPPWADLGRPSRSVPAARA